MLARGFARLTRRIGGKVPVRYFGDKKKDGKEEKTKAPEAGHEHDHDLAEPVLEKEFVQENLNRDQIYKLIDKAFPHDKSSKVHISRLQKEIDHLMRDRDEVRALKDTKRTFDMIKEKHQHMLEELKGRLTESEDDKSRMRERLQGEVEKEKVFAISKFAKDIVEIFDNLERAMSHATEAEKSGNMYKGLELTHSQGLQTLNRFNIKPMEDPVGKKFDTNFHEVVFEQTNPKHDAGTVSHVMRKGYLIKDRLLRTATVGVTKKD